jgi:hypothetical protein
MARKTGSLWEMKLRLDSLAQLRPADVLKDAAVNQMITKEILLELAEKLPPDATFSDAIYELEFR